MKTQIQTADMPPRNIGDKVANALIYIILILVSLTCILPILHVLAKSLSADRFVMEKSVYILPKGLTFAAFERVIGDPSMVRSLVYTIIVTVLFTLIGMILITCAAYPLTKKRLKGRGVISFIFLFTMYFSAGVIPEYMLINNLNIINTPWAIILPLTFSAYNMIIMKSFIQTNIPDSLEESAFLDGASHFTILTKIVLPLSKPIIATLCLFFAVGRWNAYQDSLYYITNAKFYVLQHKLFLLVGNASDAASIAASEGSAVMGSPEVLKAACIMFATIPIVCIYPFVQKYFVKGTMVGAVKG
ncbi:carbohydrate ABC transporter permease [Anaerobium acetethylicum]|uniref:Putative aldouronate transport system permease protein n=1 Tax=Anaerobium acetethylicum TaxID=1619234 RepID=A0A1D3TVL8_9FIRM|nr:carbohydrate ABC transporter permease [Anaerobium acetethylicum]SCP98189.1 putative aldouronate transport system permease protein [Anaerobium acetethylicum]